MKTLRIGLIVMGLLLSTNAAVVFVTAAGPMRAPDSSRRALVLPPLPAELVVPARLPSGMQDVMLLEAWVRLYNHREPVQLWDGRSLTGQQLAQVLLDQDIPVVWNAGGVCGNGSCSRLYCRKEGCTYDDGQPGVDPIFIHLGYQADMPGLVATLAHETFHRMQPFGAVPDTRFEEFWAFWVEARATDHVVLDHMDYDPLVSGQLMLWIRDNNIAPYYALPEYPDAVLPLVASVNAGVDSFSGIPAEAYGNGQNSP